MTGGKPVVVFLATDTKMVVDYFRRVLVPANVSVLVVPQDYPRQGDGVSYNGYHVNRSTCLNSWKHQMMDMMILSEYSDILIAGQYSSFTQSLPLSRILWNNNNNNNNNQGQQQQQRFFCDVDKPASALQCSSNKDDGWLTGRRRQLFFPVQLTTQKLEELIRDNARQRV
jgi:hypothetical protein